MKTKAKSKEERKELKCKNCNHPIKKCNGNWFHYFDFGKWKETKNKGFNDYGIMCVGYDVDCLCGYPEVKQIDEVNKMEQAKERKFYSIIKSAKWFSEKNLKFLKPKEFIVVRHNIKKETLNPAKQVNSIKEGIEYIKSKNGIYFKEGNLL